MKGHRELQTEQFDEAERLIHQNGQQGGAGAQNADLDLSPATVEVNKHLAIGQLVEFITEVCDDKV